MLNFLVDKLRSNPTNPTRQIQATLQQPATKRCWICLDEDTDDPTQTWSKPCKCKSTLEFVHEECLIRWIKENQSLFKNTINCPVCSTPYRIKRSNDPVLFLADVTDKVIDAFVPVITFGAISISVLVACASYGGYAIVTMCGEESSTQILSDKNLTPEILVCLPFIPLSLIFSSINNNQSLLPFLCLTALIEHNAEIVKYPAHFLSLGFIAGFVIPGGRQVYRFIWNWVDEYFFGRDERVDENRKIITQRGVIQSLFVPAICSYTGGLLNSISWFSSRITSVFQRNMIGGYVFFITKDLLNFFIKLYRKRKGNGGFRIIDYPPYGPAL